MAKGSRRGAREAAALEARKRGDDDGPLRPPAGQQVEDGYVVRSVSAGDSGRRYRCPGCDHELPAGTPHVVAWPQGREDDRRHWHTACWAARDRRGVRAHRAKNAPRHG